MNDPIRTIQNILNSRTISKWLAYLVVGANAAFLLKSHNPFLITMTLALLVLVAVCIIAASYNEFQKKTDQPDDPGEPDRKRNKVTLENCLMLFLLFMTLSVWM